ncbi:MAG TPA: CRISPR-associated protein Cas2 [Candidatus Saccharimonadales bacterium]|nr:CRISPR-associated protein Cas2 [Candidatus Saccharimonadales bacterium]
MVLQIAYDLHNPGRDYDDVIAAIKTASSWAHPQGSVWLIDTSSSPETWVNKLKAAGDTNDEYLVTRLTGNWASRNMDTDVADWLKSSGRTW